MSEVLNNERDWLAYMTAIEQEELERYGPDYAARVRRVRHRAP